MHKFTISNYINMALPQSFSIIIVRSKSFDILWSYRLNEACLLDQNKFLSLLKEIKVFWNILRLWWALTQQTNHICEGHESTYDVENIQLLSISKETLPIQCSYNGVLINLMLSCLRVFKKNKNKKNPSFYKGRIKKACLRNTYVEITVKF